MADGSPSTEAGSAGPASTAAPTHLKIEGKLVIIGDSFSGKTSIISVFTKGETNTAPRPSIGVAYSKQTVHVPGATVIMSVWDTAGQEKFRSINSLYYRNSAAAIVVFDLTSAASFRNVASWLEEIRKNGGRSMIMALAGNKADLKTSRAVSFEEAKAFADSQHMMYFETSAKTGAGINEMFRAIAMQAPRAVQSAASPGAEGGAGATPSAPVDGFRILAVEAATSTVALDGAAGRKATSGGGGCCG